MSAIVINAAVPVLGWALLNFIWQGLVVGAAAGVLLVMLSDANPRSRYAVCALALVLCLCIPVIDLLVLLDRSRDLPSPPLAAGLPAWRPDWQARLHMLVMAWAAGVGLMALRLVLGLAWVSRLRRDAVFAPVIWQARLDTLALRLGLAPGLGLGLDVTVRLKLHAALASPITVGFWRPVVLLPAALLSGMPVAMLEALLAHELAHVRRWDYLVNLLQSLVESLLFFHPVVWWLSTRMRVEREQVADALAVQALDDPRNLALALSALSTIAPAAGPLSGRSPLILSSRGGHLLQRIEQLMMPPPETASWKLALPAMLLACATLLMQAHGPSSASKARLVDAAATGPNVGAEGAGAGTSADAGATASLLRLPLNARHALVLDEGGRILMAKDADAVVPIASLTKLLTAMVLLDSRPDLNETLRVVDGDIGKFKQRGAVLTAGAQVPRAVVLQLALMSSENRAAAVLARTYPGGGAAFAQALRAKIHSLGLTRTTITDPTGAGPTNTSTATEVARIVTAAARYPEIAAMTSNRQASVAVNGRMHALHNTNALVGGKGWDIGLSKTGSSNEAGSCLTMRLRLHGGAGNVTVVLLDADGPERRSLDASGIRDSLAHARANTDSMSTTF